LIDNAVGEVPCHPHFFANESIYSLLFVHLSVEVPISRCLKNVKVFRYLSEYLTCTELLAQSADLLGFFGVVKGLHLFLLILIDLLETLNLFFVAIVSLLLVVETLTPISLSHFPRLIWL